MTKRLAIAAAWLVGLAGACGGPGNAPARAAAAPRPVELHEVGTAALPRTVAVTGGLAAHEELVLGLQVGGRLLQLGVDVGDRVAAGDQLAALDPRDFDLEHARAAAALATALARLGQGDAGADVEAAAPVREAQAVLVEARLQRERVVTMVQEQLKAPADLEAADAALAVATSRLQRARDDVRTWIAEARQRRAELAQVEKRQQDARLLAPWPGRVGARHAAAGQVVGAGERVLTLLRTDPLRLRLPVPERLAPGVAVGQTVRFTVDGGAAERSGRVVRLGAGLDRSNRTLLVEAEVGNADGALLPGGFCRAQIVVAAAEPVVVVPKQAVASFAGVDRVFCVDAPPGTPGPAVGVIVQLGREAGAVVEVVRGVAAGARIVADATGLAPGVPVVGR
ncbi:MAG: efflux RND transporter periplasmic adaptor subunit [Planctomycetes bacterium]|nr:efflux RND transporter periplasmic adaptor subunit [Planctomycetota bacterium]